MKEKQRLERIIKLSTQTKIAATTIALEYIDYIRKGLQPDVSLQYVEMIYRGEVYRGYDKPSVLIDQYERLVKNENKT